MRLALWVGLVALICAAPAAAWERMGGTWLFANDALGDRHDRWRTTSLQAGVFFAPETTRAGPDRVELRLATQAITPWRFDAPAPDDRRLAGVASIGLHGHWHHPGREVSLGADLVGVGSWVGYETIFRAVHGADGGPSDAVTDAQLGPDAYPTAFGTTAWPVALAAGTTMRPFVEAQIGVESYVRAGADMYLGQLRTAFSPARDGVTGFPMPLTGRLASEPWPSGRRAPQTGIMVGADAAHVANSAFLPGDEPAPPRRLRLRARAGGLWQVRQAQVFYGVTWLGREFATQPEAQVVGALHVGLRF